MGVRIRNAWLRRHLCAFGFMPARASSRPSEKRAPDGRVCAGLSLRTSTVTVSASRAATTTRVLRLGRRERRMRLSLVGGCDLR